MIYDRMENHPGARFLLVVACLVVVVAGLKAAAPVLVPFALALFLAIVTMPIMFGLRVRRVPAAMAIFLAVMVDVLVFGLLILLGANAMGALTLRLPVYRVALVDLMERSAGWLAAKGLPELEYLTSGLFNPEAIFGVVGNTVQWAASLFTVAVLVTIIMCFILAEATVFPFKFQAILGHDRTSRIRITKTIGEIQAYLGIKTLISLATGILAGVFSWSMGLDFPVLLGLIAFVLNYIPTIGSIIAAVPAMMIALILYDAPRMLLVGLGYLAINTAFGNIIEPNVMGRRMGLSTLVVVLSLLFWGWVWGPVGALLSVPLTMVTKIVLENTPDLSWIAVLLDKAPPQARWGSEPGAAPPEGAVTGAETVEAWERRASKEEPAAGTSRPSEAAG